MGDKMKVLITGASGLVGMELSKLLLKQGHSIVATGRSDEAKFRKKFFLPCEYYQWLDPKNTEPPVSVLNVDAAIHLMGENLAARRWTKNVKKELYDSRILSTRNLVSALNKSEKCKTLISASAIGIYGDQGDRPLNEGSATTRGDFLGDLCNKWEEEAKSFKGHTCTPRIGVVLSSKGGAIEEMTPIFQNGLGGALGSGEQWMSWIHLTDLIRLLDHLLKNPVEILNAVAPHPVQNIEFTKNLNMALRVRGFLPVPKAILKLIKGEMSKIVLASHRVESKNLKGFDFLYPKLEIALSEIFDWVGDKNDRMFYSETWVPSRLSDVFSFFSNEKNLEKITPEFLTFKVLNKSTDQIQEGTKISYKLKIHGFPVKWKSQITNWSPDEKFQDTQSSGPYKKWEHSHEFQSLAEGTSVTDKVVYQLPLAGFGGNFANWFIRKDICKIFDYRTRIINEEFG